MKRRLPSASSAAVLIPVPFFITDALEPRCLPDVWILCQQSDLFQQTVLHHLIDPLIDAGIQLIARHRQTDPEDVIQRLMFLPCFPLALLRSAVCDHQRPDQPTAVVAVDRLSGLWIDERQCRIQHIIAQAFQKGLMCRIRLFFFKYIIVKRRLDIQSRTAAEDRLFSSGADRFDTGTTTLLKQPDIVFLGRIIFIDQMVRNALLFLSGDLCASDVELTVHLNGIPADDLSVQFLRQLDAERSLPDTGRTDDDDDGFFSISHVQTPFAVVHLSCR